MLRRDDKNVVFKALFVAMCFAAVFKRRERWRERPTGCCRKQASFVAMKPVLIVAVIGAIKKGIPVCGMPF